MTRFIAALPMYDWPERHGEVDSEWAAIRDRLRAAGIDAPEGLVRSNADLPPVPGGIRDNAGRVIAPDPATLPADSLDYPTLWRHPALLFAQTCWGPLGTTGLDEHVTILGQPDYSGFEGGEGQLYSSAIVMRAGDGGESDVPAPRDGVALLPLDRLKGKRLAYNEPHSMSGLLALTQDLAGAGTGLALFSGRIETGGHRASIRAVAAGTADLATIDCRSWALARQFEPAAGGLAVVGWTAQRKGLPFIAAKEFAGLFHPAFAGAITT